MSRIDPDPVFAAAVRAELERRVRSTSETRAARPRRPWVMELTAVGGVLLLVAGVAVGVEALRPALDAGGVPAAVTGSATPQPTIDPTTASLPSPTTAPTTSPPISSSALVGPTGAKQRSAAEIRSWAASLGNDPIWAEQVVIITSCMAEHGFLYDPEYNYSAGLAAQKAGLTAGQYQAFRDAFSGPQTDAPYDWRTAGCDGLAVHETGQDNAD